MKRMMQPKLTYILILEATFLSSVHKLKCGVHEGVNLITLEAMRNCYFLLVQIQNCDIFRTDFRDLQRLAQSTPLSLSVRKGRLIRAQQDSFEQV